MSVSRLTILLLIFLVICGIFYFAGTVSQNFWFSPFTDLWANLFASLLVILVIEKILQESREQERLARIEPSKRYIKGKILHALTDLIGYGAPPSDWKSRLESDSDWNDYFEKLIGVRNEALEELQNILVNPAPLLDDRLRNDVTSIVETLNSFTWKTIEISHGKDIWSLYDAAGLSVTIISQSINLIKKNNLLKNQGRLLRFKVGEAPKIEPLKGGINEERQYSIYENWLNRSIAFRDECHKRIMPEKASS